MPFAVLYFTSRAFEDYGLRWQVGGPALNAILAVLVLGGYAAGHYAFARIVQGRTFHFALPPDLPWLVYHQLIDVALPEEFFFRGYLQTNLNRAWGRPFSFLGVAWGWALP